MDQLRAEHRTEPRRIQGDQNDGRNYGYGLNGDETDEGSGKAKDNHVKNAESGEYHCGGGFGTWHQADARAGKNMSLSCVIIAGGKTEDNS